MMGVTSDGEILLSAGVREDLGFYTLRLLRCRPGFENQAGAVVEFDVEVPGPLVASVGFAKTPKIALAGRHLYVACNTADRTDSRASSKQHTTVVRLDVHQTSPRIENVYVGDESVVAVSTAVGPDGATNLAMLATKWSSGPDDPERMRLLVSQLPADGSLGRPERPPLAEVTSPSRVSDGAPSSGIIQVDVGDRFPKDVTWVGPDRVGFMFDGPFGRSFATVSPDGGNLVVAREGIQGVVAVDNRSGATAYAGIETSPAETRRVVVFRGMHDGTIVHEPPGTRAVEPPLDPVMRTRIKTSDGKMYCTRQMVSVSSIDGQSVSGEVFIPPDCRGVISLLHGGPSYKLNEKLVGTADVMRYLDEGYAVVVPGFRPETGHGEDARKEGWAHWHDISASDVTVVTNAAMKIDALQGLPVHVVGISLGGIVAGVIAARAGDPNGLSRNVPEMESLVSVAAHAPFVDAELYGRTATTYDYGRFDFAKDVPELSLLAHFEDRLGRSLPAVGVPMLFTFGADDPHVVPANAALVERAIAGKRGSGLVTIKMLAGVEHVVRGKEPIDRWFRMVFDSVQKAEQTSLVRAVTNYLDLSYPNSDAPTTSTLAHEWKRVSERVDRFRAEHGGKPVSEVALNGLDQLARGLAVHALSLAIDGPAETVSSSRTSRLFRRMFGKGSSGRSGVDFVSELERIKQKGGGWEPFARSRGGDYLDHFAKSDAVMRRFADRYTETVDAAARVLSLNPTDDARTAWRRLQQAGLLDGISARTPWARQAPPKDAATTTFFGAATLLERTQRLGSSYHLRCEHLEAARVLVAASPALGAFGDPMDRETVARGVSEDYDPADLEHALVRIAVAASGGPEAVRDSSQPWTRNSRVTTALTDGRRWVVHDSGSSLDLR